MRRPRAETLCNSPPVFLSVQLCEPAWWLTAPSLPFPLKPRVPVLLAEVGSPRCTWWGW